MTRSTFGVIPGLAALVFAAAFLTACGDDDDFAPVSRNRGYDYALKSTKEFADYPCNEMREGREAVVGRDKDSYYCQFDYRDSVYIWAGYDDTLTATGKEFVRADASSSSRGSSSSYDDDDDTRISRSSSSYSSSSYSSSRYSSSSYYTSSSSRKKVDASPRLTEKGEQFNPAITYGTMTDPRDGKKYRTVNINGQTWMAENLNYTGNEYGQAFCYNDEEEFCELYGRLYTRDAALNSPDCPSGTYCRLGYGPLQGICPEDWHIPTVSEATLLMNYIGKDIIDWASTKGWKPEFFTDSIKDTYGLSFVPGGFHEDKGFRALDSVSFMWVYLPNDAQRYFVINANTDEIFIHTYSAYVSVPVRCVKGEMKPFSSSSYSSSAARSSSSSYSSSSSARVSSSSVTLQPYSSSEPRKYTYKDSTDAYTVTVPATRDGYFNPNIDYGTMTDPRDGKTYKTVEVLGRTWMAENLNYAGNTVGRSACYKDSNEMCDRYGRTYSRAAAMNVSTCAYTNYCDPGEEPVQGICPNGWHLPSTSEVWELVLREKGNATPFMSAYGWVDDPNAILPGENTYGLSFLGAGPKDKIGLYAFMWVSHYDDNQHYFIVQGQQNHVLIIDYGDYGTSEVYASVRCIKNE